MRAPRATALAVALTLGGAGCALIDAFSGGSDARPPASDGRDPADGGDGNDAGESIDGGHEIPFESAQLWAIHPPIAQIGATVLLEGEFSAASTNLAYLHRLESEVEVDFRSVPRAELQVAGIDFYTGELSISAESTTSHTAELRLSPFPLGLTRIQAHYDQTNGARTMPSLDAPRFAMTAHVRRGWVYLIGGNAETAVARARINVDGTMTSFESAGSGLVQARTYHASALLGDAIYVLGGEHEGFTMSSVERAELVPETGDIGNFATYSHSLSKDRSGAAAAVVGSYLYVIGGGSNSEGLLRSIERAEILENGDLGPFELVSAELTTARRTHRVHVSGGNLYVIGGRDGSVALRSVERFDILPDGDLRHSAEEASLQEKRGGPVTVELGDRLYVLGGVDTQPLATVEVATIDEDGKLGAFADAGFALPTPRAYAASVIAGNDLYLLGGVRTSTPIATVDRGPIAAEGVLSMSVAGAAGTLTQARRGHAVAAAADRLFAFGGVAGDDYLDSVDAYEDGVLQFPFGSVGMWDQSRSGACAAVLDRTIYFIGGADHDDNASDLIEYGQLESTFGTPLQTSSRALTTPRKWTACVALGGYLYVIGGADSQVLDSIERAPFDSSGQLTGDFEVVAGATLPTARSRHTVAVLGNNLYAFGGADGTGQPIDTIERAPISSDGTVGAFSNVGTMPKPRSGHGTVAIGPRLYVFAGGATGDFDFALINGDGTLSLPFQGTTVGLPQGRDAPAVITVGNFLYVLGGAGGADPTNSIFEVPLGDG